MTDWQWQALTTPACKLAESPRYAHGQWMWVDIDQRQLHRITHSDLFRNTPNKSPGQLVQSHALPDEIGCVLPTANPNVQVGLGRQGAWRIQFDAQTPTFELKLPAPFDSKKHRFNDGRADPTGRIWISTLVDARSPPTAALYTIERGHAKEQIEGLIVGNGLAFSPSGRTAFLSDTRHKCIWKFRFDAEQGTLSDRTLVHQYTEGTARPDGACFSSDGSYWVAILEGYRLDRFSEAGELLEQIALPLAKPTMPCFGGEHGNVLMVCAAQESDTHPNRAGFEGRQVIACTTPYTGLAEHFADPAHLQG